VGFVNVITSLGKHAKDGFVTVTKKLDARAVKSSENKKIGRNFSTLCTGYVTCHLFLLFPLGSKIKLCLFHFTPRKSQHCDLQNSLKEKLQLPSIVCKKKSLHVYVTEVDLHLRNIGVMPDTCLIAPFCGRLKPDQNLIPIHISHLHARHLVRPVVWLSLHLALLR